MSDIPEVLFVCVHNAGRSQMAAAFLHHHAGGRVQVRSAGSAPAERVNPAVAAAMAERGIDLSQAFPRPLTDEAVRAADVVVTMGCGDACPIYPGRRYEDWELQDPAGQPVEVVRRIRDEIETRVRRLLAELLPTGTRDDRWLAAVWPFVRDRLPPTPASVLEIGCGTLGGFVPALLEAGYEAVGVDPDAPEGPHYRRVEFEDHDPPGPVDAAVASLSLHHVADLEVALDRLADLLAPGGALVVVEFCWERFDEATARWCFARLAPPAPEAEPGWLHHHGERWSASGQRWDRYLRDWAAQEGLHPGERILRGLDARFTPRFRADRPYLFANLDGTTEAEEQAAIDAGLIRPVGTRYAATRP